MKEDRSHLSESQRLFAETAAALRLAVLNAHLAGWSRNEVEAIVYDTYFGIEHNGIQWVKDNLPTE